MRIVVVEAGSPNAKWYLESETVVLDVPDTADVEGITMTAQAYYTNMRLMGEKAGLTVFDTALPLNWTDDVQETTGRFPYGFVWNYSTGSVFGMPFPLTRDAFAHLQEYMAAKVG
jgi:hypothetical protein